MNFAEAQVIVREIMENTPVSEQLRLLRLFKNPRAEQIDPPPLKRLSKSNRGPSGDKGDDKPITMAVSTGKI